MITIVNFKTISTTGLSRNNVINCGRPSPLGNPFFLRDINNDAERDQVIAKYRRWLWEKIKLNDAAVLEAIAQIKDDSNLGCYCAPKRCHCEVIVAAREWLKSHGDR